MDSFQCIMKFYAFSIGQICSDSKMSNKSVVPGLNWLMGALKVTALMPWSKNSKLSLSLVYFMLLINWIEALRCTAIPFLYKINPELHQTSTMKFQTRIFHSFTLIYVWNAAITRTVAASIFINQHNHQKMIHIYLTVISKVAMASRRLRKKMRTMNIVAVASMMFYCLLNTAGNLTMAVTTTHANPSLYFMRNMLSAAGIELPGALVITFQVFIQFLIDSSYVLSALVLGCTVCFGELFQDLRLKIEEKTTTNDNYNKNVENGMFLMDGTIDLVEIREEWLSISETVESLDSLSSFTTLCTMATCFSAALLDIFVLASNPPEAPFIYMWILWLFAGCLNLLLYSIVASYLNHASCSVIETVLKIPNKFLADDAVTTQQLVLFNGIQISGGVGLSLFGMAVIRKEIIFTVNFRKIKRNFLSTVIFR